jgi:hypothetical protein
MVADDAAFRDQRKSERVSTKLEVHFRPLSEADAEQLLGIEVLPELPAAVAAAPASLGHTENLSQGGMSLTGELRGLGPAGLGKGRKLWVEFSVNEGHQVRAMAVVAWSIEGRGEHSKFTAGLMFLGISPDDLDRVGHYVEARKDR